MVKALIRDGSVESFNDKENVFESLEFTQDRSDSL